MADDIAQPVDPSRPSRIRRATRAPSPPPPRPSRSRRASPSPPPSLSPPDGLRSRSRSPPVTQSVLNLSKLEDDDLIIAEQDTDKEEKPDLQQDSSASETTTIEKTDPWVVSVGAAPTRRRAIYWSATVPPDQWVHFDVSQYQYIASLD